MRRWGWVLLLVVACDTSPPSTIEELPNKKLSLVISFNPPAPQPRGPKDSRTSRGDAPFVVLKILLHHWLSDGRPVTTDWLAKTTGYSYPTVARALQSFGSSSNGNRTGESAFGGFRMTNSPACSRSPTGFGRRCALPTVRYSRGHRRLTFVAWRN